MAFNRALAYRLLCDKAVTKGAAFLDEHCPNWRQQVDLGLLDMGNGDYCILGQVARYDMANFRNQLEEILVKHPSSSGFWRASYLFATALGEDSMDGEWSMDHGFYAPDPSRRWYYTDWEVDTWAVLQEAWVDYLHPSPKEIAHVV